MRPTQLLERVARAGLLAAVVPAEWLERDDLAETRARWLQDATLRLVVSLPHPVGPARPGAAIVLLQRAAVGAEPAGSFRPECERMGRFHLRRYLQEVLRKL
jgi:hypothetical protein